MSEIKAVDEKSSKDRAQPQRAKVGYPYYNLNDSIQVAKAVHDKGGGSCTRDQIASFLDYSTTKSGAFLTRISAARMFGLINVNKDNISVSDRAQNILSPVMPQDAERAKIAAFLAVPLFKAVYERFKGSTLPADVGLKNLYKKEYGLSEDRITPALRVTLESAEQAGFFKIGGKQKLIKPPMRGDNEQIAGHDKEQKKVDSTDTGQSPPPPPPSFSSGGDEPPSGIHAAIVGLLRELPRPGTKWPQAQKNGFMTAFKATLDFIYPDEDGAGDGGGGDQ